MEQPTGLTARHGPYILLEMGVKFSRLPFPLKLKKKMLCSFYLKSIETEIFHELVYSPNTYNSWAWPGCRNSILVFSVVAGSKDCVTTCCSHPIMHISRNARPEAKAGHEPGHSAVFMSSGVRCGC